MYAKDKILEMFFEPDRWLYALGKGIDKDIRKDQLYQLTKKDVRMNIAQLMREGRYVISPPHTAKIPKDNGDFRTVYVNEPVDRIILSIANDLLFELCPEMVHPRCKSYLKGIGCDKVVQEASQRLRQTKGEIIGFKSDLSKYFDSVPLMFIDAVFDTVEQKHGKSALIDVIRLYYHSNIYLDEELNVCSNFQSLKQGCAVAAFLADAILYHIDERMSKEFNGFYTRYSDDMLYIGEDYEKALECVKEELGNMDMKVNDKKTERLKRDEWFKFLGYSLRGGDISMSPTRIKTFQKEIEKRTIGHRGVSIRKAINDVNRYLYKGNGEFSWATQILPVVNVQEDIDTMNTFIMDCFRAVITGKRKIGGLGYIFNQKVGCISRGKGRNVKANREKTDKEITGYLTLNTMRKAMLTSRAVYKTLTMSL